MTGDFLGESMEKVPMQIAKRLACFEGACFDRGWLDRGWLDRGRLDRGAAT